MAEDDASKEYERFFFLVGYAISRWAYIDRSLFDLCKFALNTTEHKTAIVFHRKPSIGEHLSLTDELLRASELQPRPLEHWNKIKLAMENLLPFRNDIAHNPPAQAGYMTIIMDKDDPSKSHVINRKQQMEIRTDQTKLLRQSKKKKNQGVKVTSENITEHIKKVATLQKAIYALSWELTGRPKGLGPTIPAPEFPTDLN